MTHEQFIYWLKGFLELHSGESLGKEQLGIIKQYLGSCFTPKAPYFKEYISDTIRGEYKIIPSTCDQKVSFGGTTSAYCPTTYTN
jgi:hypothetical protein